ncbi:hypothetical protein EC2726950_0407 [Escherichia coli 2726950]|nr:hypothetical protein ECDEC13C_3177 [Escherichia coli DEC13C]EMX19100.1 hypothetical protein ECP03018671_3050 [Escherichia coli P0301867.1]EMX84201.1 hypothetical protein EC2719100_3377 [Escherichia coli 2719100]ENA40110.1 hypothetical protein ECP03018672_5051 [Escherichia coli P0301867.2]ENA57305.1 hypothetical protein EC2726950_0407 [Escherichia coli 2726950]ENA69773.1 hypothetical protein EC178900_5209 [Escherichia coli 178900]ENC87829.1 hypothetical protein ECP030186711_4891 [Escherichi
MYELESLLCNFQKFLMRENKLTLQLMAEHCHQLAKDQLQDQH